MPRNAHEVNEPFICNQCREGNHHKCSNPIRCKCTVPEEMWEYDKADKDRKEVHGE